MDHDGNNEVESDSDGISSDTGGGEEISSERESTSSSNTSGSESGRSSTHKRNRRYGFLII